MRSDVDPPDARVGVISPKIGEVNGVSKVPHPGLPGEQSIWRNRDFLLLWLAQAISQTAQTR